MKKKLVIFILGIHLLLIVAGTSMVDFEKIPEVLQKPIGYYLAMTGGHPYNFFSPDIPMQIVVKCYILDTAGRLSVIHFDKNTNTFELRTNYVFQLLNNTDDLETAADIAAKYCFRQCKDAASVRVSIGKWVVPSIEEYKVGKSSNFAEIYTQTFKHG